MKHPRTSRWNISNSAKNHRSFSLINKFSTRREKSGRGFVPPIMLASLLVIFLMFPMAQLKLAPGASVTAFDESINTFASSDCATPKSEWNLGQTACAVATGAGSDRRIAWVAPNGAVAKVSDFFSGTDSDSYSIPTGSDQFAQVGTWIAEVVDTNGVSLAEALFVVKDPAHNNVDLSIGKFGPFQVSAEANATYSVEIINRGPDAAQNVVVTDAIPAGMTFVSETQDTGPTFTCSAPASGSSTGSVSCTIASLPANASASFTLTFNVNAEAATGSVLSNTATISSSTNELRPSDNSGTATSTVISNTAVCSITCPTVAPVDSAQCTAVVTFATPTTAGACGTSEEGGSPVLCSPPSGSTFPVGATTVTCTAPSGDTCSFAVTVNYTGSSSALSITCPGDLIVNADDVIAGTATVNYTQATATGSCVTVSCTPPPGSIFPLGTSPVTCTATDASQASMTCTFNVTVNNASSGGCTIFCPDDVSQTATTGCSALVSYPAPTTGGTCGVATCSPASGSSFPVGSTIVTCSTPEGASCSFVVTVISSTPPTITHCATDRTLSAVSDCSAPTPNFVSEVTTTGCSVVVTQSPAAGTPLEVGAHTVTITAENSAGSVTCTVTFTVVETPPFTGFFSPVDNPPTINTVNAGRGIPVKFSLGGDFGLDIFEAGYPASQPVECSSSAPLDEVTETVTAGGSSLSFGNNQYTYIWKTEASWAGTCRVLIIRLKNGCEHRAIFKFR